MSKPEFGGSGGATKFDKQCPAGSYVAKISGETEGYVKKICMTCSDGTDLGCVGVPGKTPYSYEGPFGTVTGRAGGWIDNLLGAGGEGGAPFTKTCPENTYVSGIVGSNGEFIDNLGFNCGYTKPAAKAADADKKSNDTTSDSNSSSDNFLGLPIWLWVVIIVVACCLAGCLIFYAVRKKPSQLDIFNAENRPPLDRQSSDMPRPRYPMPPNNYRTAVPGMYTQEQQGLPGQPF